jgi:hypothetical protein
MRIKPVSTQPKCQPADITFTTKRGVPKIRYSSMGKLHHYGTDGSVAVPTDADNSSIDWGSVAKIALGAGLLVFIVKLAD